MALEKNIELNSGVAVRYHRVAGVTISTNVNNVIEVASYTSEAKRREEAGAIAAGESMDVFVHTTLYEAEYDQNMTVVTAYNWLRENVEAFSNAEDA